MQEKMITTKFFNITFSISIIIRNGEMREKIFNEPSAKNLVEINIFDLKYTTHDTHNKNKTVLNAVSKCGSSLQYASFELQENLK